MGFKLFLDQEIQKQYKLLVDAVSQVASKHKIEKVIDGTGGKISIVDLIAYQIGWGKCLIRWYEKGLEGEITEMPGEGFSKWDYKGIAQHFYKEYAYDGATGQMQVLQEVVSKITKIIQVEDKNGNLDSNGVWEWCTLASGKKWPLSKWIKVNTVAPYKRAIQLIKKAKYT